MGVHEHNWYPVQAQGQPPTDEWVCIVQGCGYRIMPPAVLTALLAARVSDVLALVRALHITGSLSDDAASAFIDALDPLGDPP